MNNVASWLAEACTTWQEREALVTEQQRLTYGQLDAQARRFANQCSNWGIRSGERIAIYGPNSAEAVIAILGSLKRGAVFLCIHPDTPWVKAAEIIHDAQASMVVSSVTYPSWLHIRSVRLVLYTGDGSQGNDEAVDKGTPRPAMSFGTWLSAGGPEDRTYTQTGELAALIYTSGSTGKPKGVMSSHANIRFTTDAINHFLVHRPDDRVLSYLPLSFDYGLYQLFLTLSRGASLHLRNGGRYIAMDVRKQLMNVGITGFPGLRALFAGITEFNDAIYENIRYLTNTGDFLPDATIGRLIDRFPNAELFLMYGVTECKRVSYLPPSLVASHRNSTGVPLNGTEAVVMDENGEECPPDTAGELVVWGEHVCMGYWMDERRTQEVFLNRNGIRGLRTGDLFCKDSDGFLYFLGRKDSMFKSRGFRIDPLEIENILSAHLDEIIEVVAVGIPDRHAGHKIGVYMVLREGTDEAACIQRARSVAKDRLELWKQPERFLIGRDMLLTPSGKIDRQAVRRRMSEGGDC
ncbi:class I adenylate-forming enzyme family protein [Paenibacillus sp. SYP-B4298]|uniref:class I adenylate-forming enzyme family protein n=1 Tax=Paenibacillus sp. SYP-B4298 TaxID=2996034 RepID=UPI0022DD1413|nr:class I adenylate-forming enzyme family protein [Paenibacillus sp. SYP-B4298]